MKLAVVLICVSSAVAAADPELPPPSHRVAGLAKYNDGDYDGASAELELAYADEPAPELLYAWAQSERKGGRCEHAVELYRKFVATGPAQVQVDAANNGIDACTPKQPPVAGGLVVTTPLPPPKHVAPPPPPPPPQPAWYRDYTADALVGTGAASVILGGVFLVVAHDSVSDAKSATTLDSVHAHLDDATTQRRVAAVALIAGAALAGTGAVLWLRDHHAEVTADSHGATLAIGGRF